MPHLWITQNENWQPAPLNGEPVALLAAGPRPLALEAPAAVRLCVAGGDWLVLAPPGEVVVNGAPLLAGARLLRDRDELALGDGSRFFFSTERLAAVEIFPGPQAVFCARCRLPIEPGTPAVRCPSCRLWMHQNDEFGCWVYAPTCVCPQATDLDAGFTWTPDEL